ncbi:sigma-70 family RNA polymerase sigma factor [Sedimentisphaera salicampi]|uniref:RNA polymerase sigma factor n=1 Tax=Sedimentisphaera salicampi TaxID=1941349 RepID=A0A1W6LLB5_9BACT|nr:sigma-70 family RNA polymerase sigma factor [Sedimentisphaera salicampi]ARN56546.1 RNA polymerase sigma factor [Sedimentisphaera salicampi]OXU15433.1 RNA polymerase sigma factor [Sedimentisphaera salicampi]
MKKDSQTEDFVNLLINSQGRIYAYILSLVGNHDDAEDIMQEAVSVMWQKFDSFEKGTSFIAWAFTISKYQVMNFRRTKARHAENLFSENVFELLAEKAETESGDDEKMECLGECVANLKKNHFDILKMKYFYGLPVREIASRIGLGKTAVYKRLSRLHAFLKDCVERRMKARSRLDG